MNMIVSTAIAGTAVATSTDPIFAAIDAHKAAAAITQTVHELHSKLDRELPIEKSRSRVTAWEEEIVETDDPRWIEAERAVMRAFEVEDDAACVLAGTKPTTSAGLLALLRYAVDADTDGEKWPRELRSDDDTKTRPWHFFLIETIADALPELLAAA